MSKQVSISYKEGVVQSVLTVGTTASLFPDLGMVGIEQIFVQAPSINTAPIVIGKSNVLANFTNGGWELPPGANFSVPINDRGILYAISAATGQLLLITYMKGTG